MRIRRIGLAAILGICFPAIAGSEKTADVQQVVITRPANSAASREILPPAGAAVPGDVARSDHELVGGRKAVRGEVLVAFRPEVARGRADAIRFGLGAEEVDQLDQIGVRVWRLPPGLAVAEAVGALSREPAVRFAEPNLVMSILEGPTDPSFVNPVGWPFGYQEHLRHDGATTREIHAEEAWAADNFGRDVVVAVVDTGVDLDHPDLDNNLYRDAAGTIIGGNFFSTRSLSGGQSDQHAMAPGGKPGTTTGKSPMDDHGHGTHVAGLIAAEMNNMSDQTLATPAATVAWKGGVVGVAPQAKIMPVKVLDSSGSGSADGIAKGILFAADHNAKIVNMSLGGPFSQTMSDAINYAWGKDVLVVTAAGNSASEIPQFPASELHTVAVAAVDSADKCASFSNRGWWVDVAAPGVAVLSTFIDGNGAYTNGYGRMSGTSMASPVAAGVAALIRSKFPDLKADQVMAQLLATAENIDADNPGLEGKLGTGRVNAFAAVSAVAAPVVSVQGLGAPGGSIMSLGPSDLIFVRFSHAMDRASVLDLRSYQLLRADNASVPLVMSSTDYQPFPGQGVRLRVSQELPVGSYQLVVSVKPAAADGGAALTYAHSFNIAPVPVPALTSVLPLGSLAYRGSAKMQFRPVDAVGLGSESASNETLATAGTLPGWYSVGGNTYRSVLSASVSPTNDVDYYKISAVVGDIVSVSMNALDPAAALDSYLELRDASDAILTYNDDDRNTTVGTWDSRIAGFVIPANGNYYIRAYSWHNASSGPYKLVVDLTTANPPALVTTLPAAVPRTFSLDLDGDQTVSAWVHVREQASVSLYHNGIDVTPGVDDDTGLGVRYQSVGPLQAGRLVVSVQPSDPWSTGECSLEVLLNGVFEVDAYPGVQSITSYFQPLDASADTWRAAVVGKLLNWGPRIYQETPGVDNDLRGNWDKIDTDHWGINATANNATPLNRGVTGTLTAVSRSVQTDRWFFDANEGDVLSLRVWGRDTGGGTAKNLRAQVEISGPGWAAWYYGGSVSSSPSDYAITGFRVPQTGRCGINVYCGDTRSVGTYTLTAELNSPIDPRTDADDSYSFSLEAGLTCEVAADPRVNLSVTQTGNDYSVVVTPKVGGVIDYGLAITVNAAFDKPTGNETWQTAQALNKGTAGHLGSGVVGYFTDLYESTRAPEPAIRRAGMTPVHIDQIASFDFSTIQVLMLDTQNEPPSANLVGRLPDIEAWVRAGGILMIHDRRVSSTEGVAEYNPLLVGASTTTMLERSPLYGTDINVITAGTLVTSGPGGTVGDSTLDNGYYSNHGFAYANTLPSGAVAILSAGPDANRVAAFRYPLGSGQVYYSTIPLDFYLDYYLDGGGSDPVVRNFAEIYAPNVVAYASSFGARDLEDWYMLGSFDAGRTISVETRTPADGSGEFKNVLDPRIDLFSSAGPIEVTRTFLPDGRNEKITYKVPAADTYYLRVTAEEGTQGEYFLAPLVVAQP